MATATDNSTETILSPGTISALERIRRANYGVEACARIVFEDSINQECAPPDEGRVFLRIPNDTVGGLLSAIDVCTEVIAVTFADHFDELGVTWGKSFTQHFTELEKREKETELLLRRVDRGVS